MAEYRTAAGEEVEIVGEICTTCPLCGGPLGDDGQCLVRCPERRQDRTDEEKQER